MQGKRHVLKEPEPLIWFTEMAESSLNFELKFYVDDLTNKWSTHQKIITDLYTSLNKAKVTIPFPQREVWVHNVRNKK